MKLVRGWKWIVDGAYGEGSFELLQKAPEFLLLKVRFAVVLGG